MILRILAAVTAVLLAALGVFLVVAYANNADERALADLETQPVFVANQTVESGIRVADLDEVVEVREVPQAFVVEGAVRDLDELDGRVLTADLAAGEQLQASRFATPEELRARSEFELPEGAENLHQVTIPLANPRALGGNIAAGDTVGVFVSIDAEGGSGYVLGADGEVTPAGDEEDEGGGGGGSVSMTHLTLHKVLVVRVEGGYVAPPSTGDQGDVEAQEAADSVNVTLALEAPDAEKVVFGMEYGQVWLSLEPEGASEAGTEIVVVTVPDEARNVFE